MPAGVRRDLWTHGRGMQPAGVRYCLLENTTAPRAEWEEASATCKTMREDHARIVKLAVEGICTDGVHHKQWFLEEIANIPNDRREGIAP